MLAEFLSAWKQEVTAALRPEVTEFDRKKDRLVTLADGKTQTIPADFPDLNQTAGNLDTIKSLIETNLAAQVEPAVSPEVWFNRTGVTAIFDPKTYRRNRATMSLQLSEEIIILSNIHKAQKKAEDLIRELRVKFKVCDFTACIAALRNVKFEINETGEHSIERTKVSMGKSQMARLYGLDALQETMVFTVPVFASKYREYFSVSASLDPDVQTKMFTVSPYPGEVEKAIEQAEVSLGDHLLTTLPENTPVFFGTP